MQTCNISCSVQMKDSSTQKRKLSNKSTHPWALRGRGHRRHYARWTCNVLFPYAASSHNTFTGSSYCFARAISCVLLGGVRVAGAVFCDVFVFSLWIGRATLEGQSSTHRGRHPAGGGGGTFHNSTEQLWITLIPFVKKQTNKKKQLSVQHLLLGSWFWKFLSSEANAFGSSLLIFRTVIVVSVFM